MPAQGGRAAHRTGQFRAFIHMAFPELGLSKRRRQRERNATD